MNVPKTEVWYQWKEYVKIEGSGSRLLMPWRDPNEYEYPIDQMYETIEEAEEAKRELAPEEDWWLVKVTTEVVKRGEIILEEEDN